jgi:putative DNA primase/helicase
VASSISRAVIYHAADQNPLTLLVDEGDTLSLGKNELRGILNAGHSRDSAFVRRTVPLKGGGSRIVEYSLWYPKAVALIGQLPHTLSDRSIKIEMPRKSAGDAVKRPGPALTELCRRAARWAADNGKALKRQMPHLQGISDRAMDNWTPLFAVAERCGDDWLQKAEAAALAIEPDYEKQQNLELLNMPDELRLLADIKAIFDGLDTDEILSAELVKKLCLLPESDWRKYRHGGPISQRGVAVLLAKFKLVSKKGGPRKDLEPAWSCYLPQAPQAPQAPHPAQNGTRNPELADDAELAEEG